MHNGTTLHTDPLMRVGPGVYETAVMLSGEGEVRWNIYKAVKRTNPNHIKLTQFGEIIKVVKNS